MQSLKYFDWMMLARLFFVGFIFFDCHVPISRAATLTWDFNGATSPNPADGSGNSLTGRSRRQCCLQLARRHGSLHPLLRHQPECARGVDGNDQCSLLREQLMDGGG